MADRRLRLEAIEVIGLFGRRDYFIPLDPQRPTVLTGSNGTGKSTILRLINAVATADLRVLSDAPLASLALRFDSGAPVQLRRRSDTVVQISSGRNRHDLTSRLSEGGPIPRWALDAAYEYGESGESADQFLREVARDAGFSYEEYLSARRAIRKSTRGETPDWLTEISDSFGVLYITDQRLIVESDKALARPGRGRNATPRSLAVERASTRIAEMIQEADSLYTRVSLQEDRRFPRDVIAAMNRQSATDRGKIVDLVLAAEERRVALRKVGLLDSDDSYQPEFDPAGVDSRVAPVIETFLSAALRKMAVLDGMGARLSAFTNFLDGRFAGKRAILDRETGLRFELDGGRLIRPGELSSGEQQVTVLAFEILFNSANATLALIDEPELSLHVLWQDSLIDDLQRMGDSAGLKFLMATHSPTILAGHPELERSLDEMRWF